MGRFNKNRIALPDVKKRDGKNAALRAENNSPHAERCDQKTRPILQEEYIVL